MSTLVSEPLVEEAHVISPAFTKFQHDGTEHDLPPEAATTAEEKNPLIVIFIASIIAFHVAAAMIGTVMAWIYQLRNSGAFTP